MKGWGRQLITKTYHVLLASYPPEFQTEFGDEMQTVFEASMLEAEKTDWAQMLMLFGREIRDFPGSVWREHLYIKKGQIMNQKHSNWQPPTTQEILVTLGLFVIAVITFVFFSAIVFASGSSLPDWLKYTLFFMPLAAILAAVVFGVIKSFPRWSIPYVGFTLTSAIFFGISWQLWDLIVPFVYQALGGRPSTLLTRVSYGALKSGFSWSLTLIAAILLVLLLMVWPRTRQLAHSIRADWTLFSFLLYGGVVVAILLIFGDEYRYSDPWLVAAWACMAVGAWFYQKSKTVRKRILALLAGVTLAYWITAVGKWYLVPLQTWGAFHGYQYETYSWFEFWRTLAEWGWVIFFMLIPALLTLITRSQEIVPIHEEKLIGEQQI